MAHDSRDAFGNSTPGTSDRGAAGGQFVINLCSLPAPITVPQPRASRLSRYTFFLSHGWEDGRRQYRLQMGYFGSPAEADKWLATLKRVYPSAHVAKAPDSQPDLMSTTQRLRIIDIGRVGASAVAAHAPAPADSRTSRPPVGRPTAVPSAAVSERHANPGAPTRRTEPRPEPTLEDTLNELRTSGFDMGPEDDLNATGVRHLRVEVQQTSRARQVTGVRTRK